MIKTEEYKCPFCGHKQKIKFIVEDEFIPEEGQSCKECDEPFDLDKWSDNYLDDEDEDDDDYEIENEEFIRRHGFFIDDEDDEYDEYDEDDDYEDE